MSDPRDISLLATGEKAKKTTQAAFEGGCHESCHETNCCFLSNCCFCGVDRAAPGHDVDELCGRCAALQGQRRGDVATGRGVRHVRGVPSERAKPGRRIAQRYRD